MHIIGYAAFNAAEFVFRAYLFITWCMSSCMFNLDNTKKLIIHWTIFFTLMQIHIFISIYRHSSYTHTLVNHSIYIVYIHTGIHLLFTQLPEICKFSDNLRVSTILCCVFLKPLITHKPKPQIYNSHTLAYPRNMFVLWLLLL